MESSKFDSYTCRIRKTRCYCFPKTRILAIHYFDVRSLNLLKNGEERKMLLVLLKLLLRKICILIKAIFKKKKITPQVKSTIFFFKGFFLRKWSRIYETVFLNWYILDVGGVKSDRPRKRGGGGGYGFFKNMNNPNKHDRKSIMYKQPKKSHAGRKFS